MELSFTGDEYEVNRNFAERRGGVAEISRVSIGPAFVTFADGTRATVSKPARAEARGARRHEIAGRHSGTDR